MLLTTNCRLTETKSGTFVSQHVRPFLLFHGRLPPTSVASKIEEFGTLAACLKSWLHFLHYVSLRTDFQVLKQTCLSWIKIFVLLIMPYCRQLISDGQVLLITDETWQACHAYFKVLKYTNCSARNSVLQEFTVKLMLLQNLIEQIFFKL